MRKLGLVLGVCFLALGLSKCSKTEEARVQVDVAAEPFEKLSEYHFFVGDMNELKPNAGVLPYDLITPLFTDYAEKARFVWMPEGKQAHFVEENRVVDIPVGAVLIKNFYYSHDQRSPEQGHRIIETRVLMHRETGWDAFTYVWNDEQSEAFLEIAGEDADVSWVDLNGEQREVHYLVPNKNQCKGCHSYDGAFEPIGPKLKNLDKDYTYAEGSQNQIEAWVAAGYLDESTLPADFNTIANWEDESAPLQDRALAYLEINCGHCHNPHGPANTSGLHLVTYETDPQNLGICKGPVAAGKGSGGRKVDIHPGEPDKSIIVFRMSSTDPGIAMPEVGKTLVHTEGVELITKWIASMEGGCD